LKTTPSTLFTFGRPQTSYFIPINPNMSGPADASKNAEVKATPPKEQNPLTKLEEDDEFEDFPAEGMLSAAVIQIRDRAVG
jgi:hypothetical protein